jgi:hypothetical protein
MGSPHASVCARTPYVDVDQAVLAMVEERLKATLDQTSHPDNPERWIAWPTGDVVELHFDRLPGDEAERLTLVSRLTKRFEKPDDNGHINLPVLRVELDNETRVIRVVADESRKHLVGSVPMYNPTPPSP